MYEKGKIKCNVLLTFERLNFETSEKMNKINVKYGIAYEKA